MSMKNHPCWETAIHETAHLAVYLQLGGSWKPDMDITLRPSSGAIRLRLLWDYEFGCHLEARVLAAGVAIERIFGVQPYTGRGSDTFRLQDMAIDLGYTPERVEMIISRIERWLLKNFSLLEMTATELLRASNKNGRVIKTKSKIAVQNLKHGLVHRRRLSRKRHPKKNR